MDGDVAAVERIEGSERKGEGGGVAVCSKCDGAHPSSQCPYFKEKRFVTQEEIEAAALKLGITLPPTVEPLYINQTVYTQRNAFDRDDKHASSVAITAVSDVGVIAQCNLLNQFHPRYIGRLVISFILFVTFMCFFRLTIHPVPTNLFDLYMQKCNE